MRGRLPKTEGSLFPGDPFVYNANLPNKRRICHGVAKRYNETCHLSIAMKKSFILKQTKNHLREMFEKKGRGMIGGTLSAY